MKRMTAKKRLLVVFIAAVAVGATVALVFIFQFFGDAVRERSDLYISARTDYPGLLDSLRPRTDHHWAFDRYAGRLELERSFKPGHYVLEPGMNVVEIARMLKLGMQTPVRVTLNYARTRAFLASACWAECPAACSGHRGLRSTMSAARSLWTVPRSS